MKSLGVHPYLFPMPCYMIGTYNEDGSVDEMMMAWGGICDDNMVALNLAANHKTVANIRRRKAFTLAIPSIGVLKESDYLGTVSANKVPDKFGRCGLHAVKSELVDAPIVTEYPVTLECRLAEEHQMSYGLLMLGEIVDVKASESVLDERGKIDVSKLNTFLFDAMRNGYYAVGEKVGDAWKSGREFMKG